MSRQPVEIDGAPMTADVVERLIVAEQVSELSALGWYPFSLNSRIESALGFAHVGFTRELERIVLPRVRPLDRHARCRRDSLGRVPVFSAGLAARTVLLGALPLEIFYAHPFQRPDEDAVFGFRIGGGG